MKVTGDFDKQARESERERERGGFLFDTCGKLGAQILFDPCYLLFLFQYGQKQFPQVQFLCKNFKVIPSSGFEILVKDVLKSYATIATVIYR